MDPTCDESQAGAPCPGADALHPGAADEPAILEEIEVEDLAVDGICGVY
ncbi:MAG: variant-type mycofactocin precursor [bacterium]